MEVQSGSNVIAIKALSIVHLKKKLIMQGGRPTLEFNIHYKAKSCVKCCSSNLFINNEWLTGWLYTQKFHCWSCLLFSKSKNDWNSTGYNDMDNRHKVIKKHSMSHNHHQAIINEKTFGKARIDHILNTQARLRDSQHN